METEFLYNKILEAFQVDPPRKVARLVNAVDIDAIAENERELPAWFRISYVRGFQTGPDHPEVGAKLDDVLARSIARALIRIKQKKEVIKFMMHRQFGNTRFKNPVQAVAGYKGRTATIG
jgi:hypothetical protein